MSDYTMPFGKHRGELISEVPISYLEWISRNMTLRPPLKDHVEKELSTRPAAHRMPMGKYKDQLLADIPTSYLQWCEDNMNLRPPLKGRIRQELEGR